MFIVFDGFRPLTQTNQYASTAGSATTTGWKEESQESTPSLCPVTEKLIGEDLEMVFFTKIWLHHKILD